MYSSIVNHKRNETTIFTRFVTSHGVEAGLPPWQRLPGGLLRSPLGLQPEQVRRAHEEHLGPVALAIAVTGLLEGEVDHPVHHSGLVAAEGAHSSALPRVSSVDICPPNLHCSMFILKYTVS